MHKTHKPNHICVIGGGTGTFVALSGLKTHPVELTAIVTVADSGGSTGRLRDEFGFLPVGDLRQALAALARDEDQTWIRDLLLYRFSKGSGLEGHNLGNLILTALQDMTDSTSKAIEIAAHIFRLHGSIYPITTKDIQLVLEYEDGTTVIGEHVLDDNDLGGKRIALIKTSPRAKIYSKAAKSIRESDLIVIGPGDVYGSILPNMVVSGFKEAVSQSKAKLVYVLNLMTRYTQTHNLTGTDHVSLIENHLPRPLDKIIINSGLIPPKILQQYQSQHEYLVEDDFNLQDKRIIRENLINMSPVKQSTNDEVPRSFLRHDSQKLADVITQL